MTLSPQRRTPRAPRQHRTPWPSAPAPEPSPGPFGVARRALRTPAPSCPGSASRLDPPAHPHGTSPGTSPGTSCHRGAGAPTTSLSSPARDVPAPLGEFLSWVSTVGKSWMGAGEAQDAAAPRLHSPAQCGWMSIPPPLTAGTAGTAPEDAGTRSPSLGTCQIPRAGTGGRAAEAGGLPRCPPAPAVLHRAPGWG